MENAVAAPKEQTGSAAREIRCLRVSSITRRWVEMDSKIERANCRFELVESKATADNSRKGLKDDNSSSLVPRTEFLKLDLHGAS